MLRFFQNGREEPMNQDETGIRRAIFIVGGCLLTLVAAAWLASLAPSLGAQTAARVFLPSVGLNERAAVDAQTIRSADGRVTLDVPAGTHAASGFTITPAAVPRVIGQAYDIGPEGAVFDPPATVTFQYDDRALPRNLPESNLTAGFFSKGAWIPFSVGVSQNLISNTISARIQHLSPHGVFTSPRELTGTRPAQVTSGHGFIIPSRTIAKVDEKVTWVINLTGSTPTWRCGCEFCPLPFGISGATVSLPFGLRVDRAEGSRAGSGSQVGYAADLIPFEQSVCNGPSGYWESKVFVIETTVLTPTNTWTSVRMSTSTCCGGATASAPFGSLNKDRYARRLLASQESDRVGTRESDSFVYNIDPNQPMTFRGEDWDRFGGDILILFNDHEIAQLPPQANFEGQVTLARERFPIDSCYNTLRAVQIGADDVRRQLDVRLRPIAKVLYGEGVRDRAGSSLGRDGLVCGGAQDGQNAYGSIFNSGLVTVDPNGILIAAESIDSATGDVRDVATFIYSPARNIRVVGPVLAPVIRVAAPSGEQGVNVGPTPSLATYDPRASTRYRVYTITPEDLANTGVVNYPNLIDPQLLFAAVSTENVVNFVGRVQLGGQVGSSALVFTEGSLQIRGGVGGRGTLVGSTVLVEQGINLTAEGDAAIVSTNTVYLR
jgi:hypothetical protein